MHTSPRARVLSDWPSIEKSHSRPNQLPQRHHTNPMKIGLCARSQPPCFQTSERFKRVNFIPYCSSKHVANPPCSDKTWDGPFATSSGVTPDRDRTTRLAVSLNIISVIRILKAYLSCRLCEIRKEADKPLNYTFDVSLTAS